MKTPLLARVVFSLALIGILPIVISFYQLRANKDSLLDQVQRTHLIATRTTAKRIAVFVGRFQTLARSVATSPDLYTSPAGLVEGALLDPQAAALGVYNAEGGMVLEARGPDWKEEVETIHDPAAPPIGLFQDGRSWLRIREPLPEGRGEVVLIVAADDLAEELEVPEIGEQAAMVLASRGGGVLLGSDPDLSAFPATTVQALATPARSVKSPAGEVIGAFSRVPGLPWGVLSRQPTAVAEIAERRILQATRVSVVLALALTFVFSAAAYTTTIRPLRRLIRAQQDLVGARPAATGSEIAQLEASFAILEQRVRDRENLDKVFLGRYQVLDVLGSGAMGTVFKGWDPKLERNLALKTIRLSTEEDRREKLINSLRKEAVTSAQFSHPNIVTVFDMADEGKAAFMAMEFVDGVTLEQLIQTQKRLDWRQATLAGAAVARGLAVAHKHGRVHQDVKPANVLLGRDHSIKVTDFGISQAITSASAASDTICGTPGYIAPECLEGAGYSPRSDLFGLGVLLHEGLAGEHPFAAKNLRLTIMNTLYHDPAPIDRLYPDVPAELTALIASLLEKDPAKRPADAAEVAHVCEKLAVDRELLWSFEELPWAIPERGELMHTQMVTLHSTQAAATQAAGSQATARTADGDTVFTDE